MMNFKARSSILSRGPTGHNSEPKVGDMCNGPTMYTQRRDECSALCLAARL